MRVVLHPGAERDLAEAAAFYEAEAAPALAARFVAEFQRLTTMLSLNPGIGMPRDRGRRGFPASGFPYTVIYKEVQDGVVILVLKNDRRRPDYGIGRS